MKISVKPVWRGGNRRFAVSWRPPGKMRVKHYFKTRREADAAAEDVALQAAHSGQAWLALTGSERAEMISIWSEAKKRGVNLRAALDAFRPNIISNKLTLEAFNEFMAERTKARLSKRRIKALKSNVGRFVKVCGRKFLAQITRDDVVKWLGQPNPSTFNTYLRSLETFFNWCVRLKFLAESPAASIDKIDERRLAAVDAEPPILTVEQCARLLRACRDIDDGLVPYVACCLFAGIRPEREAKMEWREVTEDILVRGASAKTRQRRYVTIQPVLAAWLARPLPVAFGPESELHKILVQQGPAAGTLPPRNLRKRFAAVRGRAGLLDGWKQDCMRHTFASMSLVEFGAEKTIAALGHGNYEMLFRHYRALVKPDAARKFWTLMPEITNYSSDSGWRAGG